VDQEDQGDHNPPWWTRSGFYILLMKAIGVLKLAMADAIVSQMVTNQGRLSHD